MNRSLPPAGWIVVGVALVIAFVAGWGMRGPLTRAVGGPLEPSESDREAHVDFWTCSMHPQIRLPEPGRCPICNMDLVPVDAGVAAEAGEREIVFSDTARRLAQIRTAPVERRPITLEVRMVGKVDYDETRISDITSYVPGRLERLFVDYRGVTVNRGDHMVDIYSPELIAAQEELLQAIEAEKSLRHSELEIMRRTATQTVTAARERLRLWGLLEAQIAEIEKRAEAVDLITLYSPITGVVIEKHANQGSYVATGSRIYTIADLAHLWVRLEAYESDMEWLHQGQEVWFTTEAYPGTVFRGRVSFIDAVVDPRTRTVDLRVNVTNADQRLKPGMLVRAVVKARVAGVGRVFDPYLAGKWIGPMHPEIVREGPGDCDICGMPLVPAESLGFVASATDEEVPLVIPATAPLITGKRAVVYVENPHADRPTYEGREVDLGPKAGDYYVVRAGLAEGERVVVEGNFKIDSALQIQAKPSMMNPVDPPSRSSRSPAPGAASVDPSVDLTAVFEAYLKLQQALAGDDAEAARSGFERMESEVARVPDPRLSTIHASLMAGLNASDIASQRSAFQRLSIDVIALARSAGASIPSDLVVAYCPMAFDDGASWLQSGDEIRNPYFGDSMLLCGEVTETLAPAATPER